MVSYCTFVKLDVLLRQVENGGWPVCRTTMGFWREEKLFKNVNIPVPSGLLHQWKLAYNNEKNYTPEKNKHVSPIAYTNIQHRIFKRILPPETNGNANNSIIKKVQAIKQEPFIFSLDFMFQLGKGKL